jgi:hypothetical protein
MVPQIQTDQTAKVTINPAITAMRQSRRCHAKTKRTGLPCKAPAVTGYNVCRMHGAKGGAPSGTANGRYVHGSRTTKHKAMMALIRYCVTTAKEC